MKNDLVTDGREKDALTIAIDYELEQNYPNPFNSTTTIMYFVGEQGTVAIDIDDILGRRVKTFVNGLAFAGMHKPTFDATGLPSGVYFYTLRTGGASTTKKMMIR